MTTKSLLEVENLRTHFDTERGHVQAVDCISFEINEGDIFGLVGESGSGKSVTALSLMGLIDSPGEINADAIRFKGTDISQFDDRELRNIRGGEISMIFQDPMNSLNPVMTVGEQIAEVVRHRGDVDESDAFWREMVRKYATGTKTNSPSWQRTIELLDKVGIPDPEERAKEYPHQLSGGMRQRVIIAQALAGDPALIIADEPTTALDVSVEAQILNELIELANEMDVAVMLITHDLAVVRETCNRVAVMYAGELMETANVDELFENPSHPYTIGLMSSIPKISDNQEWLDVIEGSVPDLIAKPEGCPFRDRCAHAFEHCDEPLQAYEVDGSNDHIAQCHLHHPELNPEPTADTSDAHADGGRPVTTSANSLPTQEENK